jgi:hypothetical protein
MNSPKNSVGLRELAIIDAAIAMGRAYEGKEQSEPLIAKGSVEHPFTEGVTHIIATVTLINGYNGTVRDITTLFVPDSLPSTASLKTMITERNKLAATYGEVPRSE